MIVDGTITNADISATAGIDFSKLLGVAPSAHTHDSVYVNEGQVNSVTNVMISDGQVTKSKLSAAGGTSGQVLGTDGTNLAWQSTGDITGVTAGAGLTGGGASGSVTLNVQVPLSLSGSTLLGGILSGSNSNNSGFGVQGVASGTSGAGVLGSATATGAVENYGGYFEADGDTGRGVYGLSTGSSGVGVYGSASLTGPAANSGGYFTAAGNSGCGVYGSATATGAITNNGGLFLAFGDSGRGVFGSAEASGNVTNYGGWFRANGDSGYGVLGWALGSSGRGVYGSASATGTVTNYGGYFSAGGNSGRGVYGSAPAIGAVTNYGGYFSAGGDSGRGVYGIATAIGDVANYGGYFIAAGDRGYGVYGIASSTGNPINYGGYFRAYGDNGRGIEAVALGYYGIGVIGRGDDYDFYAQGPGTNYGSFTGGHDVMLSDNFPVKIKPGLIVSATGKTQVRRRDDGTITLSSTLPTVTLSTRANDKAVFGVLVKEIRLPEGHWYTPSAAERFATVNALGEGRVWVVNLNGNIEAGDYIATSSIPGYGQKQGDDILRNYTLGKAIETIEWDSVAETVEFNGELYKIYLLAVVYTSG
jgi:hypothetical protein